MTAVSEQSRQAQPAPRRVRRLAVLGDSTAVGLGDPVPGRGWRGVGPFVASALGVGPDGYLNLAFTGARMRCVRDTQLPAALAHAPDVVVVIVGMNDTLRSDFDPAALAADLEHVVTALAAAGAVVVPVRYHDHGRVFRLPGPLYRALKDRIEALNGGIDQVVARHEVPCLDLAAVPGAYELSAWSVDRLHPSELGHRLLARGLTEVLARRGIELVEPVSLVCSGGVRPRTVDHLAWLVVKGIPWLWRRGRDLVPHAARILLESAREGRRARRFAAEPEVAPGAEAGPVR
ncbi:SGNH/GDSL hydrolase family protein [Amycolatopsis cynarae]|uniref:SGNH/GDSL hydrolase family protein n=1 Tax=Amycolatopsis cynarae TaxID=2995223 RepID=A0ABY7AW24_9PSEU|nr:SGNH/GDSL hydrolase family protein [Amycolatopsis sp. HUAS 11-8]WAL63127.1 SGNH/GDSL hydrolase family protein [Amycolatopsis sp. HUAS 11-8]